MDRDTCKTCRFYEGNECHRRAPIRSDSGSRYPFVMPYQDWCGDHEPVKQEAAAETATPKPEPRLKPCRCGGRATVNVHRHPGAYSMRMVIECVDNKNPINQHSLAAEFFYNIPISDPDKQSAQDCIRKKWNESPRP